MFCIILCSHRVWNPNPSLNLNSSPAGEISHKCEQSITFVFFSVPCSNVGLSENPNNQISKHVDGRLKKRTEHSIVNQRIQPPATPRYLPVADRVLREIWTHVRKK